MNNDDVTRAVAVAGLALLLWGGAGRLSAQDFLSKPIEAGPAPQAPFVRQDDPAAYTVTFANAGERAADRSPRDVKLDVEKVAKIRHELRHLEDGGTLETWYAGRELFRKRNPFEMPIDEVQSYLASFDAALSFPELFWANAETFAGVVHVGQKVIDVFRCKDPGHGFAPFHLGGVITVYVDDETRLPLALKTGLYTATYAQHDAPGALEMPEEYQAAYRDYKQAVGIP
jgi:hypothetical protein